MKRKGRTSLEKTYDALFAWNKRNPKPVTLRKWEVGKYMTSRMEGHTVIHYECILCAVVEACLRLNHYRLVLTNDCGEYVFAGRFEQDIKGFLKLQGDYSHHEKTDNDRRNFIPTGVDTFIGSFEEFALAYCHAISIPVKQETIKLLPAPERIDLNLIKDLAVAV